MHPTFVCYSFENIESTTPSPGTPGTPPPQNNCMTFFIVSLPDFFHKVKIGRLEFSRFR